MNVLTADQKALTYKAAGGISSNDLALAGAFGFNVMDSDVEARIRQNATIKSTGGSVDVNAIMPDRYSKFCDFCIRLWRWLTLSAAHWP